MIETASEAQLARPLSSRYWVTVVLGTVVLVLLLNFALAWKVDLFGILRDAHGRALQNSRHERTAKFLLNYNYVPDNFDAMVIGTSQQANWHLNGLLPYRFYNEGMLGSDGPEERLLVDRALQTGHFKVALVGISRGITDRHDLQDALDQATPSQALGSLYCYTTLLDRTRDEVLHRPSDFHPDGSWEFPQHQLDVNGPVGRYPPHAIDEKAASDYRAMIQNLLAHHVKVVYVVAPHWDMDRDGSRPLLAEYTRWFLSYMPSAPLIDLTSAEYDAYAHDADLMMDGDHVSNKGSEVFSRLIAQRLQEILRNS